MQAYGFGALALVAAALPQVNEERLAVRSFAHGRSAFVTALVFSPDGAHLVTASLASRSHRASDVKVWHVASGRLAATLHHEFGVSDVEFSPDGATLAVGTGPTIGNAPSHFGSVVLWEPATGKRRKTLRPRRSGIQSLAFAPDGNTLAAGLSVGSRVILWDVLSGDEKARLRHFDILRIGEVHVEYSADGKILLTRLSSVNIWNVSNNQRIGRIGSQVASSALSPDGSTLALAHSNGDVTVWNLATRRRTGHVPTRHAAGVAFYPNSKLLAIWDWGDGVQLHNHRTDEQIDLRVDAQGVFSASFSPDFSRLATWQDDGLVCLWDTTTGQRAATLPGHEGFVSMAFSPDGATLATTDSLRVRLLDLTSIRQREAKQ